MNKKLAAGIEWTYVLAILLFAYSLKFMTEKSIGFLIVLILSLIWAVVYRKNFGKSTLTIMRILIGALFIFSGTVKGIDPLGTQFRIEDYLYAYNLPGMAGMALFLSIFLNLVEFITGIMLIFNIKLKFTGILTLLMMVFFTFTTLYDALYSPVPDCGCFGDFIKLTNWQTFYKNLVINAFVLVIFFRRKDFENKFSNGIQYGIAGTFIFLFTSFQVYSVRHLPVVDFRAWKIGARLLPEVMKPTKSYLTYQNKSTGETKEFLSSELPWQDTVFMANWKWVKNRIEDPNIEFMKTFPMLDEGGQNMDREIVGNENYTFIITCYNLKESDTASFFKLSKLTDELLKNGYQVVLTTSVPLEEMKAFYERNKLTMPEIYSSDDTSLKMAVRSNPGLIIVKKAVVIDHFHWRDFPTFEDLKGELK